MLINDLEIQNISCRKWQNVKILDWNVEIKNICNMFKKCPHARVNNEKRKSSKIPHNIYFLKLDFI